MRNSYEVVPRELFDGALQTRVISEFIDGEPEEGWILAKEVLFDCASETLVEQAHCPKEMEGLETCV